MALFDSIGAALRFAMGFSVNQFARVAQYGVTPIGSGRGLVGLDGAAQAGMIWQMVDALPSLQRAALVARFGPKSAPCPCESCIGGVVLDDRYKSAVTLLAKEAQREYPSADVRMVQYVVRRHFEGGMTFADIAARFDADAEDVRNVSRKVCPVLLAYEARAQAAISDRMQDGEIVECAELAA
ncbi:hypothetical protein LH462_11095 [Laribacter hongkongensis]|uniref:Uncharacterized protein n=1 Tax=Laribacter hongkongensis TaxID=168471 RepID=A0ABD4SU14_9NEIS|nr:hypothetical protein [Laribacter hongkongensis]MCG9026726.1 hypothetical protein [Laribacter hongkongensis]MCG9101610.1 hypothetical protein [Laribacter hongkongensis]MCG9104264.1 hypothetical protein [Laribacter hongkongensis]MCG9113497.1 hypothetical protein [Laribacter hongkongensis]MCG9119235.1 hypothetical protein [Laribacter hongkongensis]